MYKALKSFSGLISMKKGDIKDLKDKYIINDLLNAGYIEEVKEEAKKVEAKIKEEVKKIETKAEVKEVKPEVKPQAKNKKKKSK